MTSWPRPSTASASLVMFACALCIVVAATPLVATGQENAEDIERLKQWVYREYPLLDPSNPQHEHASDWDRVRMLRDFSYRHTAYSNNVASDAYKAGAAAVNEATSGRRPLIHAYEFLDKCQGGVVCGHSARLLQQLYATFGYKAWYIGHGFPAGPKNGGSAFTHATVLVRIEHESDGERRSLLTLHDPSTNLSFTSASSAGPIDYFDMVEALVERGADRIAWTDATGESAPQRPHPITVCLPDETKDRRPVDFLSSWNVAEGFEHSDRGNGHWVFRSPRLLSNFDELGSTMWKPELSRRGFPAETVYLYCFPFNASGPPGGSDILARAFFAAADAGSRATARALEFPRAGEWPTYRGAPTLSGHARPTGAVLSDAPRIVWTRPVGMLEHLLFVEPAEKNGVVRTVSQESTSTDDWRARWFASRDEVQIGERTMAPPRSDPTVAFADILPDVPGYERVRFESGFGLPTRNGRWQYGPGRLEAWQDGDWKTVWQTGPIDHSFNPYPMVGDFDSDGELEIAALPWRSLQIYEARTGRLESECEFTKGRSYGLLANYDFDADGSAEFLVMGDFAKHIEVLGYREGQLQLLWKHEIELDIANPQKMLTVLPEPVADIDGDKRQDVVFNLFNDTGDGRWHLIARDGITGEVKVDLADEVAQGVADLDGDQVVELLTMRTTGRFVPQFGTIQVRSIKTGSPAVLWADELAGWQEAAVPSNDHARDFSDHGRRAALIKRTGDTVRAVIRRPGADSSTELVTVRWTEGGFQPETRATGRAARALALDDAGAMLVECETVIGGEAELSLERAEVTNQHARRSEGHAAPLVIHESDGRAIIGIECDRHVAALSVEDSQALPQELWRRTGHSLTGADLHGNGSRQFVYASSSPENLARVVAVEARTGRELWHHDFDYISEGNSTWNPGGVLFCQVGRFSDAKAQDVLVTVKRSSMHSEETFLLSGRDGTLVWHRPRQIADRACGGGRYAIADYNRDGFDDAASFVTHIRYVLDGPTGRNQWAAENKWPEVPVSPVYWGMPLAGHFDTSETPSLLYCNSGGHMIGRISAAGELVWSDAYDRAPYGLPAVGDFDDDGRQDAFFVGCAEGSQCYSATDGKVQWSIPTGADRRIDGAVSGDINGDGRDEALFVLDDTLHCISVDPATEQARVVWTVSVPQAVTSPIIASLPRGNESPGSDLVVLVGAAGGQLYCIH